MPKTGKIGDNNALLVVKCIHEMQENRVMESLAASFGSEDDVKEVCLAGQGAAGQVQMNIAPAESSALFDFLSYIKSLNMLKICNCSMEHFAFSEMAKLLSKDNEITSLVMSLVRITDLDAKHIADALRSDSCKLTTLHIRGNKLTDEGAKYLVMP